MDRTFFFWTTKSLKLSITTPSLTLTKLKIILPQVVVSNATLFNEDG